MTRLRPTHPTRALTRVIIALPAMALGLAASLPATGCSGSPRPITDPSTITAEDWRQFSLAVWERLEDSGVLDRYEDRFGRAPSIAVGDFQNNTTQASFTRTKNFLYRNLESQIINSGSAVFNRDLTGLGGRREALLDDIRRLRNDPDYDPATFDQGIADIPDLIFFGSIDSDTIEAGRTTQRDFLVNVELIDPERNVAVWSEVVNVTKLWRRPLF